MPVRSALLIEVFGPRRRAWSCGSRLLLLLLLQVLLLLLLLLLRLLLRLLMLLMFLLLLLLRLLSAISTLSVSTVPRVASRTVSGESSVLLLHLLLVEMGVLLHLLHLIELHLLLLLLLLHGPGLPMPRKASSTCTARVSSRTILHHVGDDLNANANLFISLGRYYDFSWHASGHILVNLDPAA